MSETTEPVIDIGDVDTFAVGHGEAHAASRGPTGNRIGMERFGCRLTNVDPEETAFPYHVHRANEEMFVNPEGTGDCRYGENVYPIRAGDILSVPPGGAERAREISGSGSMTLKYLGISTKDQPEVVEYPNSNKFAVFSRSTDGSPKTARIRYVGRQENSLDYQGGEDGV